MLSNSPLSPSVETSPNRDRIGNNNRDGKFQYLKKGQFEFVPEHNEVNIYFKEQRNQNFQ